MTSTVHATHKVWIDATDLRLDDFRAQVLRTADPADYPLASDLRTTSSRAQGSIQGRSVRMVFRTT